MCLRNSNLNSQISTSQLPQERKSYLQIYTGSFCLKFPQLHLFFFTCPPDSTAATHSRLEAAYCKFSGSILFYFILYIRYYYISFSLIFLLYLFTKESCFFSPIFQILSVTWQNGISIFLNILNSDIKIEAVSYPCVHYRNISSYAFGEAFVYFHNFNESCFGERTVYLLLMTIWRDKLLEYVFSKIVYHTINIFHCYFYFISSV